MEALNWMRNTTVGHLSRLSARPIVLLVLLGAAWAEGVGGVNLKASQLGSWPAGVAPHGMYHRTLTILLPRLSTVTGTSAYQPVTTSAMSSAGAGQA